MAVIQCCKCKSGIHYHGEPEGIEYVFIKLSNWERIKLSKFDDCKKEYINGSTYPKLYQSDTIESDFEDAIIKAWKCPKCGTFMFYDNYENVTDAYEICETGECDIINEGCDYVVFDDYNWDRLTDSAVPNREISKICNPTCYAKMDDNRLELAGLDGKVLMNYKICNVQEEQI